MSAATEALSGEQVLTLLIQATEAAQAPGEEHEALAEQFMAVMTAPGTADVLRGVLATVSAADAGKAFYDLTVLQRDNAWREGDALRIRLEQVTRERDGLRDGGRQLLDYFAAMAERDDHDQAQDAYRHAAEMVTATLTLPALGGGAEGHTVPLALPRGQ